MSVTAQQVYNIAMVLMDNVDESGNINSDTPGYYETKAMNILTILLADFSDTSQIITDLSTIIELDDRTCLRILPYGLASELLMSEDVTQASILNNKYDELKGKVPATATSITDNFNVLDGMC